MNTKFLVLAALIVTSIACFAVVDAFDRKNNKRVEPKPVAVARDASWPAHAPTVASAGMSVARLLTNCTGTGTGAMAASTATVAKMSAGVMACCAEEEAAVAAATDHACCAEEGDTSLIATPAP